VAWELGQSQTPLTAAEQAASTPRAALKYKQHDPSLDLSFDPTGGASASASAAAASSSASAVAPAGSTQGSPSPTSLTSPLRGRNPPGGKSSIDFVNDHGHVASGRVGGAANKESDAQFLHFDPLHPVTAPARRSGAPGREAKIQITDEIDEAAAASEPLTPRRNKPLGSPHSTHSAVSFNQADFEPVHTGRKVLNSPGGFSDLSLAIAERPGSPEPVEPVRRPRDELQVDLAFHPQGVEGAEPLSPRRLRGAGATPNTSRINLAHSSSRVDADLDEANHMANHKTKRHIDAAPIAIALGSEHGSAIREAYKSSAAASSNAAEVDPAVIEQLSKAIHAHSQRLRHTFQEWNKSSNAAALPKENFLAGARALNVPLTDEQANQLYERFDADGDDALSYSEFVRMLAVTK
jgi:hypothetical protein